MKTPTLDDSRRGVGLQRPVPARPNPIQQVSLSAPRSRGVTRAQGADEGMFLHPPTALSPEYASPGGPVPSGPVGPITGPVPAEEGGFFDGWFSSGGVFESGPGATICLKGLTVGGGVYVLYPHWETNPAFSIERSNQAGTAVFVRQEDFSYGTDVTPVGWISYTMNSGLGVRARAWRFNQSSNILIVNDGSAAINSAAPLGLQNLSSTAGDQLSFASDLKISVVDLEALQGFDFGMYKLTVSGGARYTHLSQSYNHLELHGVGNTLVDAISSGSQFRGVGPTVAVELKRNLGVWGLGLYGSARGALLFGTGKQSAFQVVNNVPVAGASTSRDDLMPITELEFGVDYSKCIGHCRVYAQAALVGQVWYGAGNAANNEMIPVMVDPEVSDNSSNLGLFGGKLVLGVEF
jgi:hypothetical protein